MIIPEFMRKIAQHDKTKWSPENFAGMVLACSRTTYERADYRRRTLTGLTSPMWNYLMSAAYREASQGECE